MRFKLKGTAVKISFSFFALILLSITIKSLNSLGLVLLFALAHEAVHLAFIILLSSPPKAISLNLFGASIVRGEGAYKSCVTELIINISAPLFNLLLAVIFFLISSNNQGRDEALNSLYEINLVLGFFNIIPYYNFDGGNALFCLLSAFIAENTTNKIMTAISAIVAIAFSLISAVVFFQYNRNYTLVLISVYMLLSLLFKKQNTLDY